ncbi:NEDD4-binding protein 1-like [Hylaeus volcanicus]|uniref:NEDD4-binding protein 1-like n=1 Tax=Hylaeus volcanicus TaxID=313075 RepID=UPI0023B7AAD2|nr:NEDD4-binding protein 1-like [Hylaeus volcanicus]
MSMLNDSVIICDTTPKSNLRKNLLGSKKSPKGRKRKTFYESPLKHIQLSTKRWEQLQKQRKLMNNTRQAVKKQKLNRNSLMDGGFQDSIIILSDNESESNSPNEQNNRNNNVKKKKKPLGESSEDKQTKSRGYGVESSSKKRRKKSCSISDNNSSCLLISDTEDYDNVAVRVDNENIAPSKSINQGSDDIVVVWSSTEPSSSENESEGNKSHEKDQDNENGYRLFMVDYSPNPQNLIDIDSDETTSEEPKQNIENKEDRIKDSDLLFNKPGLKLPKAHDISGTILIKKRKSISNMLSKLEQKRSKLYSTRSEVPSTSTAVPSTSQPLNKSQSTSQPFNKSQSISQPFNNLQTTSEPTVIWEPPPQLFNNLQTTIEPTVVLESTPQLFSNLQTMTDLAVMWDPISQPFNNLQTAFQPAIGWDPTSQLFNSLQTMSQVSTRWKPTPQSFNNLQTTSQPSNTSQTTSKKPYKLRDIIVDGNNVAMAHTNNKVFSEEGLKLVIDYFKNRGHNVKVFIPHYRRSLANPLLEKWYKDDIVIFTPSRYIEGKWITSYDDRYILEYATLTNGIVISLDQYRDLYRENPAWRDTIVNRLLPPTFVGNYVMFPEDPLGRNGPTLDEFLRCKL